MERKLLASAIGECGGQEGVFPDAAAQGRS
jgi:hypothetical protein